jgi:lipoic acid synthetase
MSTRPPRKPDWLKVRFPAGPRYTQIDRYHRDNGLHSVCRSAACPNQGECWSRGTATFMILGAECTRGCRFCKVQLQPPRPPDPNEPAKVAEAVAELGLRHAVITSVTRDDLADGGAAHFAAVTAAIRQRIPGCRIELLIPDLQGNWAALAAILASGPDILGHNLETVPRLYEQVRQGASYARSLLLLQNAPAIAPGIPTKSGLMLGLGETRNEIEAVMHDLVAVNCRRLTIGQYLQPTRDHQPVIRYAPPEEFDALKQLGLEMGFDHIEAGPLVRSSYHAEEQSKEAGDDITD